MYYVRFNHGCNSWQVFAYSGDWRDISAEAARQHADRGALVLTV